MGVGQTWKKIISLAWQAKYSSTAAQYFQNSRAVWTTSSQMKKREQQSETEKDKDNKEAEEMDRERCEIVCEEKWNRTGRLEVETEDEPDKQKAETPLRSHSL